MKSLSQESPQAASAPQVIPPSPGARPGHFLPHPHIKHRRPHMPRLRTGDSARRLPQTHRLDGDRDQGGGGELPLPRNRDRYNAGHGPNRGRRSGVGGSGNWGGWGKGNAQAPRVRHRSERREMESPVKKILAKRGRGELRIPG